MRTSGHALHRWRRSLACQSLPRGYRAAREAITRSHRSTSARSPTEEDINRADAPEELEQEPDEKPNYTDRHPEHFRNPPGHVREIRDGDAPGDDPTT